MEKKIKEMRNDVCVNCHYVMECQAKIYDERCGCMKAVDILYKEGYRKQSEVIEEYRKKVYSKMEKYTIFGREYIQRIMREVEKEMKGE